MADICSYLATIILIFCKLNWFLINFINKKLKFCNIKMIENTLNNTTTTIIYN